MTTTKTLIMSALMMGASSWAVAGSDSGFYAGGSLGTASVDYSENDPDIGEVNFDDDDSAYKVFAGYNFGLVPFLNIAVEGAYADFGSQEGEIANVPGFSIDSTAWAGFGLVGFDLGPIGLFAKAGMFSWDVDFDTPLGSVSESGTDPAYGLGAKIQLGSIAVRGEYELFDLDGIDIDYFSVGASFTF